MDSQFKPSFINDTLDVMARAMANDFDKHLRIVGDKQAKPVHRNVSRQIILHYLGNMVILGFAGMERAICESRREQFNELMLEFEKRRRSLEKQKFEIFPQILEAIAGVHSPHLID